VKFAIVVFPGSNCEVDTHHVVTSVFGQECTYIWHETHGSSALDRYDCVVLPGGFAHGDYLRVAAMAAVAPVMDAVRAFAERGGLVLGICNGFQVLLEAHLLPGAVLRNRSLEHRAQWVHMRVENEQTPFTRAYRRGQVITFPISHGDGSYFADGETLRTLQDNGQVVLRYCDAEGNITPTANPNGSVENIAGIRNRRGNVLGLMPHPERACEAILGGEGGRGVFESLVGALVAA
jgi:phosphoribosylformylglycinamidine synthase subunit PurQ / glutaminase